MRRGSDAPTDQAHALLRPQVPPPPLAVRGRRGRRRRHGAALADLGGGGNSSAQPSGLPQHRSPGFRYQLVKMTSSCLAMRNKKNIACYLPQVHKKEVDRNAFTSITVENPPE
jgi:hypothetical protein